MSLELCKFLDIDAPTQSRALQLSSILTPQMDRVLDRLYAKLRRIPAGAIITDENVFDLKQKQQQHWLELFTSNFNDTYVRNTNLIGARHRDLNVDPKWYIAAYTAVKIEFINIIVEAKIPTIEKGQLIRTLEKYVAVDIGITFSSYLLSAID